MLELHEKENLYEKLKESFEEEQVRKNQRQKLLRISFIVLALIGAALTVFSFVTANMIFGIIFAILTVIFIVGIFLSKTKDVDYSTAMAQEINDLENQLDQLESNYDLEFDLDHQHRIREQWQNAIKTKEMLDEKHNYLNQTMNEAQHRLHSLTESIDKVKEELHLSPKISDELIVDSITTMGNIKSHDKYVQALNQKRTQLVNEIDQFYQHAEDVTQSHFTYFNKMSFFHDVKQWLKNAEENNDSWRKNQDETQLLSSELKQLKTRLNENNSVIKELFNHVSVEDEESYYKHHQDYETYHNNLNRFNDLTKYLENQNYSYEMSSKLSEKTTAQLDEEDSTLARQVDEYNDQYLEMQAEVSDLNAQINHMETDTTLAHLRHEYYSLKNRLNDIARDWASLSYLQNLVEEHIKQIKDKRLPQVINEAISIFKYLTNNAYTMINYSEDDTIRVKHANGQVFEPMELSQSTKELLYVALRISLIKVLKPYYPFPIIVDDAFVHFDKHRKERMLNYLRDLSKNYQVLYFTCTKDNMIPSKEMIILNKLEEGGK